MPAVVVEEGPGGIEGGRLDEAKVDELGFRGLLEVGIEGPVVDPIRLHGGGERAPGLVVHVLDEDVRRVALPLAVCGPLPLAREWDPYHWRIGGMSPCQCEGCKLKWNGWSGSVAAGRKNLIAWAGLPAYIARLSRAVAEAPWKLKLNPLAGLARNSLVER